MDEEYKNLPQTPQEANMSEVHRRYFIALLIIVALVATFSYQTPSAMYRMLHAHQDGLAPMTYSVVSGGAQRARKTLPDEVETAVAAAKCNHMVQKDANKTDGCVLVFPKEDTGYGVVFFPDGSGYTYSVSENKLRGKVIDDGGTIYAAVSALAK
jgi:hypothetical protein